MYKYFCNCCDHRFESPLPERNEAGLLNAISCPECGAWDVYPDTAEGAAQSVKAQVGYENKLMEWEDE